MSPESPFSPAKEKQGQSHQAGVGRAPGAQNVQVTAFILPWAVPWGFSPSLLPRRTVGGYSLSTIASPGSAYMTGNTRIAWDLRGYQTSVPSCQSWKASVFPRTSIISGNRRLSASPVRVPHHSKRTQVEHVTSEMNGPYGLPSQTESR